MLWRESCGTKYQTRDSNSSFCTVPPYLLGALGSFSGAYSSDIRGEKDRHFSVSIEVATIGFVVSVATPNLPARYEFSFMYIPG